MEGLKKYKGVQVSSGQVGDRKTSFFRTIIRYLKKEKKEKKKEMDNEEDDDFL